MSKSEIRLVHPSEWQTAGIFKTMKEIKLSVISPKSKDYAKELELRNEVLWKTSGLNIYDKPLNESEDYHIIAKNLDDVIGCLLLTKIDDISLKMREVAVHQSMRGFGIGKIIIAFSEEIAKQNGFKKIVISNARLNVVSFYEKQGYSIVGDQFIEFGIPRRKMEKFL